MPQPSWVGRYYHRAKNVIDSGEIEPTYGIYDFFDGAGIILVDEKNRKLFVNDEIYSFDDVKMVQMENYKKNIKLNIVLKSGENPFRTVKVGDGHKNEKGYHRLCNSLGLS